MAEHAYTGTERRFQPEIPRSRFALGLARYPDNMEDLRVGRFSDGQHTLPVPESGLHRGRFSEGEEILGDADPEKHIRRRFSEGMETRRSRAESDRAREGLSRTALERG